MSFTTTLWSQLQATLLLLLPFCLLPEALRNRTALRIGAPALALGLALPPLGDPAPSGYLYAYTGTLSLPTLALLAALAGRRLWGLEMLPQGERGTLLSGAAVAGLLLYPMALGLGPFDPYSLGFSGPWMPLLLGAAAAAAWGRGRRSAALVLLVVLWGWLLGLGESQNLWDYLLDPWLWFYSLWWLAIRFAGRS